MTDLLRNSIPGLMFGQKILSSEVLSGLDDFANVWYVDGDNGGDTNPGDTPTAAFATIGAAVAAANSDDIIFVRARAMGATATDPVSYAETIIIPAGKSRLKIIGYGFGADQGNLPQIKKGSGTTALLNIKSPGCLIANLGFNGTSSTGGGITLSDDGGVTSSSFGTVITGCHFKNCKKHSTHASAGGAITLGGAASDNGPWQVRIVGNTFYKNVGDIIMICNAAVPQDIIVENNNFLSATTSATDCNINLGGPSLSGVMGLIIRGNHFGAQPALSSGDTDLFMVLTGCYGTLSNNFFGDSGTIATTFSATGSGALIPTTVFMAGNYSETGLITR